MLLGEKMPALPPEIFLLVLERSDSETINSLGRTCRGMHMLITSNEKSIVKKWIKNFESRERLVKMPESGAIVDTACARIPVRRLVPRHSFAVIRELEVRERRVDIFLEKDGLIWRLVHNGTEFDLLSIEETQKLMAGLKRACKLVDRVVDCAADVVFENKHKLVGKGHQKRESRITALNRQRRLHWAMRRYIQSWSSPSSEVSRTDLAYLYFLMEFLMLGGDLAGVLGDPIFCYKPPIMDGLALQEVFLRYGTSALAVLLAPWYKESELRSEIQSRGAMREPVDGEGEGEGESAGEVVNTDSEIASRSIEGIAHAREEQFRPLSVWLLKRTKNVLVEMQGFENGRAARFEKEEDDDGTEVLPSLSSAFLQVVRERFLGVSPSSSCPSSSGGNGDGDGNDNQDSVRLNAARALQLRKVVMVKLLVDVGFCSL